MGTTEKIQLKVIILGDSNVGKSSILNKYINNEFTENYKLTVGLDILTKDVVINNHNVQLQLWDTAGQEKFKSLAQAYYHEANCCVIVYDLTCTDSLKNLNSWRNEFLIQRNNFNMPKPEEFPFIVLGNKRDLGYTNIKSRAEHWCRSKNNIPHFETSAKDGRNIELAFEIITKNAMK